MKISIQILGTGTCDISPTIALSLENFCVLLNCGEGTQRNLTQNSLKFSKIKAILLSRLTWEYLGGLSGFLLSASDSGIKSIHVYGPRLLNHVIYASRSFLQRPALSLSVGEIGNSRFSIFGMSVRSFQLVPYQRKSIYQESREQSDYMSGETITQLKRIFRYKNISTNLDLSVLEDADIGVATEEDGERCLLDMSFSNMPKTQVEAQRQSICYVFKGPDSQGKLLEEKIKEFGIPKTDVRRQLVSGHSVEINGRIVHSKDCLGNPVAGTAILYVDVPDISYLPPLFELRNIMDEYDKIDYIIHNIGNDVYLDPGYCKWVLSFGSTVEHILLNNGQMCQVPIFRTPFYLQKLSSAINPQLYHTFWHESRDHEERPFHEINHKIISYLSRPCMTFHPKPKHCIEYKELEIDEKYFKDIKELPFESLECGRKKEEDSKNTYQLYFLGTGSAIPSKCRNVTGHYFHIDGHGGFILDCGEGTYGQIVRMFGDSDRQLDTGNIFSSLVFVFVSHLHSDHHIGLIKILVERKKYFARTNKDSFPIVIIGPHVLSLWLNEYGLVEDLGLYEFVSSTLLVGGSQSPVLQLYGKSLKSHLNHRLGLDIKTVPVEHISTSYAIIIESLTGWKAVYSGDTRPSNELSEAGKDADLLIHEGTFGEEYQDLAISKKHSTFTEAVQVGIKMNAKHLLITHFSQRYPLLSDVLELEEVKRLYEIYGRKINIVFASDFMSVRHDWLHKINVVNQKVVEYLKDETLKKIIKDKNTK